MNELSTTAQRHSYTRTTVRQAAHTQSTFGHTHDLSGIPTRRGHVDTNNIRSHNSRNDSQLSEEKWHPTSLITPRTPNNAEMQRAGGLSNAEDATHVFAKLSGGHPRTSAARPHGSAVVETTYTCTASCHAHRSLDALAGTQGSLEAQQAHAQAHAYGRHTT